MLAYNRLERYANIKVQPPENSKYIVHTWLLKHNIRYFAVKYSNRAFTD